MRVIKQANKPALYHLPCKCGAVVECERSELRYEQDQRDGDAYVLKCPECGDENWFSLNALDKRQAARSGA